MSVIWAYTISTDQIIIYMNTQIGLTVNVCNFYSHWVEATDKILWQKIVVTLFLEAAQG